MSCWTVSHTHIDLLVSALYKYEVPTVSQLTPDAIGHLLWDTNYRSVNARYGEEIPTPPYQHAPQQSILGDMGAGYGLLGTVAELVRQPCFVYKQLRCYSYQSCECEDWEQSEAAGLMGALETVVLAGLGLSPEEVCRQEAYDEAPWGIED
jgi:hypothetical protein